MPGTTRVSTATAPMAGRGQFRGAAGDLLSRGKAKPDKPDNDLLPDEDDEDKPTPDNDLLPDEDDEKDQDDGKPVGREDDENKKDDDEDKDKKKEPLFSK